MLGGAKHLVALGGGTRPFGRLRRPQGDKGGPLSQTLEWTPSLKEAACFWLASHAIGERVWTKQSFQRKLESRDHRRAGAYVSGFRPPPE